MNLKLWQNSIKLNYFNLMQPDLSIIIPTLNEERNLPLLLSDLVQQRKIIIEIIIADGGSTDATLECVDTITHSSNISIIPLHTAAGRAQQMNRGAALATAMDLLFLHADSRLFDKNILTTSIKHMCEQRQLQKNDAVGGHFELRFIRNGNPGSLAYYFFEAKTHLNRMDTINGDQGFWISKRFFNTLGKFDESLPFMEDARLARKIFHSGTWVTLPGQLSTSARRFESEGLRQRQVLNAFICNFDNMRLDAFFDHAKDIYRSQANTDKLNLRPYLLMIHKLVLSRGIIFTLKSWYKTGGYIVDNAWQLAFALDCRTNRENKQLPGSGPHVWLARYDKWLAPIITMVPGRVITAFLTFLWFYLLLLYLTINS